MKKKVNTIKKHNAKDKGCNEGFLRVLVSDLDEKRKEINRIAAIPLATFVADVNALTVALYAGDVEECVAYLALRGGDLRRVAAEEAKAFHFDMDKIQKAARRKYFENNLRKLLKIAATDSDAGAKLAQVFYCFLEHADEHHLSCALRSEMEAFLDCVGNRDGFVIKGQRGNEIWERFYITDDNDVA